MRTMYYAIVRQKFTGEYSETLFITKWAAIRAAVMEWNELTETEKAVYGSFEVVKCSVVDGKIDILWTVVKTIK